MDFIVNSILIYFNYWHVRQTDQILHPVYHIHCISYTTTAELITPLTYTSVNWSRIIQDFFPKAFLLFPV